MEGEGSLQNWLKDTGREVARAAGNELKTVAKDKAASYARNLIGMGLKEELNKAAGAVGQAALNEGKKQALKSASSMLGLGLKEQLGDAAGAVGKAAMDEAKKHGKHKAKELIGRYFGGDGITKPCSIKIGDLRKAITMARKANHITGPANKEQLMMIGEKHADIPGKGGDRIRRAYMEQGSARRTVSDLRDMRGEIKSLFHPPVSKLNRETLIRYVYMTAKYLGWSWSQLEGIAPSRRQPKGCRGSAAPGRNPDPPAYGTKAKRKPSAYNTFIKNHMAKNKQGDVRDRFKAAVDAWKASSGRRASAQKGAQTRRNKKEEKARRAQVRKEIAEEKREAGKERFRANQERLRKEAPYLLPGAKKIPRKSLPRKAKGDGWGEY
jgi:hypothetical protein